MEREGLSDRSLVSLLARARGLAAPLYKAEDKNNSNLNRRMMGRFRRFIDDMELQELSLRVVFTPGRVNVTPPPLSALIAFSPLRSGCWISLIMTSLRSLLIARIMRRFC